MKNTKVILGVLAALVIVAAAIFATNPAIFQGRLNLKKTVSQTIDTAHMPFYKTIPKGVSLKKSDPVRIILNNYAGTSYLRLNDYTDGNRELSIGFAYENGGPTVRLTGHYTPDGYLDVSVGDRFRLQGQHSDYYIIVEDISGNSESATLLLSIVQKNR